MMADSADFSALTLEQQKECICIITEASAKSARDSIAFSNPEDIELRLMRLNSISQAVFTQDRKLADALIGHSEFSAKLLAVVDGCPALRDPSAFEEAFASAKRQHIEKERLDIINDFSNKPDSLPQKNSKLKSNTRKSIAWRNKFAKVTLFAVKALFSVASAAGIKLEPNCQTSNNEGLAPNRSNCSRTRLHEEGVFCGNAPSSCKCLSK